MDAPAHNIFEFNEVVFSSNFDNGNLARVEKVKDHEYRIWSAPDNMGTDHQSKHCAWFHFQINGLPQGCNLRISLVNVSSHSGLYKHDMRPVFKSNSTNQRWCRLRNSVKYIRNEDIVSLTFDHLIDANDDRIFFAFTYPYTYSMLQSDLAVMDNYSCDFMNPDSIYCCRELLTESVENRRIDLLTITSAEGWTSEQEPLLPGLFPTPNRPLVFPAKEVIFISARVHPGEVPAQHTWKGIFNLLLDKTDLIAKELRRRYVFKMVPMLNPDGVYRGHFRMDQLGQNLNRYYLEPDSMQQPSIYAAKALLDYYARQGRLALYLDLHAHASKRGCFIYGNVLNNLEDQVQNQLYCKLIAMNSAHFDYEGCLFSRDHMSRIDPGDMDKGLTAEGSGRVATYLAHGIVHSYTLECNYNTGKTGNEIAAMDSDPGGLIGAQSSCPFTANPEKYTPATYAGVGRACIIAMLDIRAVNPCGRISKSKFKCLERVRMAVLGEVRVKKEFRNYSAGVAKKRSSAVSSGGGGGDSSETSGACLSGWRRVACDHKYEHGDVIEQINFEALAAASKISSQHQDPLQTRRPIPVVPNANNISGNIVCSSGTRKCSDLSPSLPAKSVASQTGTNTRVVGQANMMTTNRRLIGNSTYNSNGNSAGMIVYDHSISVTAAKKESEVTSDLNNGISSVAASTNHPGSVSTAFCPGDEPLPTNSFYNRISPRSDAKQGKAGGGFPRPPRLNSHQPGSPALSQALGLDLNNHIITGTAAVAGAVARDSLQPRQPVGRLLRKLNSFRVSEDQVSGSVQPQPSRRLQGHTMQAAGVAFILANSRGNTPRLASADDQTNRKSAEKSHNNAELSSERQLIDKNNSNSIGYDNDNNKNDNNNQTIATTIACYSATNSPVRSGDSKLAILHQSNSQSNLAALIQQSNSSSGNLAHMVHMNTQGRHTHQLLQDEHDSCDNHGGRGELPVPFSPVGSSGNLVHLLSSGSSGNNTHRVNGAGEVFTDCLPAVQHQQHQQHQQCPPIKSFSRSTNQQEQQQQQSLLLDMPVDLSQPSSPNSIGLTKGLRKKSIQNQIEGSPVGLSLLKPSQDSNSTSSPTVRRELPSPVMSRSPKRISSLSS